MTEAFISYRGVSFDMDGQRYALSGRSGFSVRKDGLDEFASGVSWTGEDVTRPGAHGAFALPAFMQSTLRPVNAWALADSLQALGVLRDEIFALGRGGGFHELTWNDGATRRVTLAQVRSVSGWRFHRWRDPIVAAVSVSWSCPDPWWFGESRTVPVPRGGRAVVETFGTEEAWPVVTVTGPSAQGYTLTAGGSSLRVLASVPAGGSHRIDMETGSVIDHNGVELQQAVLGLPFSVSPREPLEVAFAASGGQALVEVTDRFI